MTPATLTVTSLNDSGPGTLRDAITQANTDPGRDTIGFASGVRGTILLSTPLPELTNDLLLIGPGASALTVSRNPSAPGFGIFAIPAGSNVLISGLTITEGAGSRGGGIDNAGQLTVRGDVIVDNRALEGGGIYNTGGVTVADSVISNNTGEELGGGIDNFAGTLTVTHCIIASNMAGDAGGISNAGGILTPTTPLTPGIATLANCIIQGNSAQSFGGGVDDFADTNLSVTDCTFIGNRAAESGGGLRATDFTSLTGSAFTANTAGRDGGAIDYSSHLGAGRLTLTNTTISENKAIRNGGGLIVENRGTDSFIDLTIASNTAAGLANGFFSDRG